MSLAAVTVFCGSSPGTRPEYADAARALAKEIAGRGVRLVYGGAAVGLMGTLADAVVAAGGAVTGVIPEGVIEREVAHRGLADLRIVATMHERKQLMADLSDGFIALPGGLGTLEEVFEVLTWAQLSMHTKPCGILNVAGFFDRLIAFLDHAVAERFIRPVHREMILIDDEPARLLGRMAAYVAPPVAKWIDRDTT